MRRSLKEGDAIASAGGFSPSSRSRVGGGTVEQSLVAATPQHKLDPRLGDSQHLAPMAQAGDLEPVHFALVGLGRAGNFHLQSMK